MKILGIETSCDETAVCIIDADGDFGFASPKLHAKAGDDFRFGVLGNSLISQAKIHAQYGGVFPNLAKREHAKNLVPILESALREAENLREGKTDTSADKLNEILSREPELYEQLSVFLQNYARPEIDALAVTVGPGLEPTLWVGINFAHALSVVWNIPVVAVNHMEGHLILSMMEIQQHPNYSQILENLRIEGGMHRIQFPMLGLLISGGHTELVLSGQWQKYEVVGATRDDAVGEAFDKVARLLGLPYPGGPEISRLAEKARACDEVSPHRIKLPRPMINDDNFDFSFAGLKTAVRRIVEANSPLTEEMKLMIAREFEDAAADVLVAKTIRAVDEYGAQTIIVGGGVSANSYIRLRLAEALEKVGSTPLLVPPPELATDNALMIALAGYFRAIRKEFTEPAELRANGNLKLA